MEDKLYYQEKGPQKREKLIVFRDLRLKATAFKTKE